MNRSKTEIREAVIGDLAILKTFEQEIISFERSFATNIKENPVSYYDLKELIIANNAQVLVAIIDNEIIGSGFAQILTNKPYLEPKQYAYLGFMFVSPQHRGRGINGELTKQLIEWAKSKNISEIQLDVYAENEIAKSAYNKTGFKPDLLKMRLNTSE